MRPMASEKASGRRGGGERVRLTGGVAGEPPRRSGAWAEIRRHDLERRQRLVRILALGILVPVVLLIPSSLFPRFILGSLVALIIVGTGTAAALALNRLHLTVAAGTSLIMGVALALAWQIVSKVLLQHGVDALDLRYYDLMVLPVLLSAVLLGRRGPLVIAGCVSVFSLVSLLVLPRTPTLDAYWNATYPYSLGSAYDVVALAVLFQWVAGVIGWLGGDSIRRALVHALRADELAQANAQIQAQAREIEAHRLRLQDGMAQIQAVHAAIARGNWDARVRLDQGELLPMAMSLNLLLDRLTRLTREQGQRAQIEVTAHELALAMRQARTGHAYTVPSYTGTVLDEALIEFAAMRQIFPGMQNDGGQASPFAPAPLFIEQRPPDGVWSAGWGAGSAPNGSNVANGAFDLGEWPSLE